MMKPDGLGTGNCDFHVTCVMGLDHWKKNKQKSLLADFLIKSHEEISLTC